MKKVFEAHLIPLNKNYPNIPSYDQFRPIVILSPMFKLLELRFKAKLQKYLKNKMDVN